jgi:hypothetical protein
MVVKILAVGLLTITNSVATFGWGRFFETVIGLRLPWTFTLVHGLALFPILVFVINPQIVNVSSSYTGIALFLLLLSGVKWTLITTHLKTLF